MNLSKTFALTGSQEALLSRGLSFIPTPRCGSRVELMGDIHAFNRQIKILDHFDLMAHAHTLLISPIGNQLLKVSQPQYRL